MSEIVETEEYIYTLIENVDTENANFDIFLFEPGEYVSMQVNPIRQISPFNRCTKIYESFILFSHWKTDIFLKFGIGIRYYEFKKIEERLILLSNILTSTASCCQAFLDQLLFFDFSRDGWYFKMGNSFKCIYCPVCNNKLPMPPRDRLDRFQAIGRL